ncbi:hypothetical protein [Paenibacillus sp. sgz500958]|uniref:hypothetical protein n=1 Tax=Paenibacillus sp. sgz500958 TaxID=3242475 RepID=UPI0036D2C11A
MERAWWVGAVLLLSAASAVVLPRLADLDSVMRQGPGVVETFRGDKSRTLNENNLVDLLGALPFTLTIDNVGWNNSVLSLDLRVTSNDLEPQQIYKDMALAISFAFQDTTNVNQLLLRIIAEDKWIGSRRMLLAGDIRRTEWTLHSLQDLETTGDVMLPDRLRIGFRISESDLWKKQFTTP